MSKSCNIKRAYFEKGTRFYVLILRCDLLGDWVVLRINGGKRTKLCKMRTDVCENHEAALKHFDKLFKYRVNARKYTHISEQC